MNATKFQRAVIPFAIVLGFAGTSSRRRRRPFRFKVPLSGAQCVPPVDTGGTGTADLTYDPATRVVTWKIPYSGLSSPTTMAHFHGPAKQGENAPVVIWLTKQGSPARKPDNGQRHAHSGAGAAVLRGRVVHKRAHPVPSGGRDPRSGDPSQELIGTT